ncbi:hypothetical protein [Chitinophaga silvatica]|nr:hypothetical protein [Chitinophaga silvatica]
MLNDDNLDRIHKMVVLYSLQHLCIDDYIPVLTAVYTLYKNKKVDEEFMFTAIVQHLSIEVIKNYNNVHVQKVLNNVLPLLKEKAKQDNIKEILSGSIWKNLKTYYRESGVPMPWTCD